MQISLDVEARSVGSRMKSAGFEFDPTAIITIAFAIWQQCLQKRSPEANSAEYLRARYKDGRFDPQLLAESRAGARRANRIAYRRGQSTKRRLSDDELDQITTSAFLHVMDADDEVLEACRAEAFGMAFDDDGDDE